MFNEVRVYNKNGKLKKIISPETLEKQFWINAKDNDLKKKGRKRPYVLGKRI